MSRKSEGTSFEEIAKEIISERKGVTLQKGVPVLVGVTTKKKHKFDLGNIDEKILVECKHHSWTATGNSPSAKMTIWNEAMLYFLLTPKDFTNILFVKNSICDQKRESLADYYFRTYSHLIPENVEIWEYNPETEEIKIHINTLE
ncbi:hypothetical protein [Pontibacter sp. H249]|uniref:hypothetical protein n=1 Tax=Pontibacter sp. H249 TaxID=3133420 RepID=UPI0030BA67A2